MRTYLQKRMDSYLRDRGVTPKYAEEAGLYPVTGAQARDLSSPFFRDSIVIPYKHPFTRKPHEKLVRFRYLSDSLSTAADSKQVRFAQSKGSGVEAYFDPHMDWRKVSKNVSISVHFVEGEIKALAMNQRGIVTIGLGGVDSFGGAELTPWLSEVLG
jgi:hypothetical protein